MDTQRCVPPGTKCTECQKTGSRRKIVCNDQDFADVTDDAVSLYFMKTKLGDRIEPKANERAEVIREIHKFGHLGVNKVQSAVVESYFWRGMNDDIRADKVARSQGHSS